MAWTSLSLVLTSTTDETVVLRASGVPGISEATDPLPKIFPVGVTIRL